MDREFLTGMGLDAESANKILEAFSSEISNIKISAAKEKALELSKAKNQKAVSALLDMDKVEISDDGSIIGLSEQISALKNAEATQFLFETDAHVKGALPGEKGDTAAVNLDNMSYEQLCEHFSE